MRTRRPIPIVEPGRVVADHAARKEGFASPWDLKREDAEIRQRDVLVVSRQCVTIGGWHLVNVAAAATTRFQRVMPTDAATWGHRVREAYLPATCRLVYAEVWTSADVTAGTGYLMFRSIAVDGGFVDYPYQEAMLSSTAPFNTRTGFRVPFETALPLEAQSWINPWIITDGSWAPATLELGCLFVVEIDESDA